MYQSGYGNNGNNGNEGNGINNMYINNNLRGYSSRHSDYDNAFNMEILLFWKTRTVLTKRITRMVVKKET